MALFVQYLHLIASLPFLTEHHVKVCRIHYTQSWIGLWAHNEFDRPVKISSSYSLQKNVLFISCLRLTELGKKMSTIMLSPILYFILFFPALFLLKVWLYHQRETAPFLNGIIGVIFSSVKKSLPCWEPLHRLWMVKLLSFYYLLFIQILGEPEDQTAFLPHYLHQGELWQCFA